MRTPTTRATSVVSRALSSSDLSLRVALTPFTAAPVPADGVCCRTPITDREPLAIAGLLAGGV